MAVQEIINARSWLFAPGDSERKMEKATGGPADIVLLDLEDAVAVDEKPKARPLVADFLRANTDQRDRLWVRINPIDGPHALADLVAVVPARPAGLMLPKVSSRADLVLLDNYLTALETAAGDAPGGIKVIILAPETAAGVLSAGDYAGSPRLAAMTWGAEDLATDIGALSNRGADGEYDFTHQLARSVCIIGAAAAGVPAIDTVHTDFRDGAGLRRRAIEARRCGFRGMLAIHPNQVEPINESYTPSAEEQAAAQEVVDLFAANPGAGTIGHKGGMLDMPHLIRARAILAAAAASRR